MKYIFGDNDSKKIAIIGTGTSVGIEIATHIASINTKVFLFDIYSKNQALGKNIINNILKHNNNKYLEKKYNKNIIHCNLTNNTKLLSECDIVFDCSDENIEFKNKIISKICHHIKNDCWLIIYLNKIKFNSIIKSIPEKNIQNSCCITFKLPLINHSIIEVTPHKKINNKILNGIYIILKKKFGKAVIINPKNHISIINIIAVASMMKAIYLGIKLKLPIELIDSILLSHMNIGIFKYINSMQINHIIDCAQYIKKHLNISEIIDKKNQDLIFEIIEKISSSNYINNKFYHNSNNKQYVLDLDNFDYREVNLNCLDIYMSKNKYSVKNISQMKNYQNIYEEFTWKYFFNIWQFIASNIEKLFVNISDLKKIFEFEFYWHQNTLNIFNEEQWNALAKISKEYHKSNFYSWQKLINMKLTNPFEHWQYLKSSICDTKSIIFFQNKNIKKHIYKSDFTNAFTYDGTNLICKIELNSNSIGYPELYYEIAKIIEIAEKKFATLIIMQTSMDTNSSHNINNLLNLYQNNGMWCQINNILKKNIASIELINQTKIPTIGIIQNQCHNIDLSIMLACDTRIVWENANISFDSLNANIITTNHWNKYISYFLQNKNYQSQLNIIKKIFNSIFYKQKILNLLAPHDIISNEKNNLINKAISQSKYIIKKTNNEDKAIILGEEPYNSIKENLQRQYTNKKISTRKYSIGLQFAEILTGGIVKKYSKISSNFLCQKEINRALHSIQQNHEHTRNNKYYLQQNNIS